MEEKGVEIYPFSTVTGSFWSFSHAVFKTILECGYHYPIHRWENWGLEMIYPMLCHKYLVLLGVLLTLKSILHPGWQKDNLCSFVHLFHKYALSTFAGGTELRKSRPSRAPVKLTVWCHSDAPHPNLLFALGLVWFCFVFNSWGEELTDCEHQ